MQANERRSLPAGAKAPVVFDIDGVLADFIAGYRQRASLITGKPLDIYGHDKSMTFEAVPELNEEEARLAVESIMSKPNGRFWEGLPSAVSEETWLRIRELTEQRDVYFVTAREGPEVKQQTEAWLLEHLSIRPTVIISSAKADECRALSAGWSIEDRLENAVSIAATSGARSCLINRSYNRKVLPDFPQGFDSHQFMRVDSVDEYLNIINGESNE